MPTKTTRRAFFSDPEQFILSFPLPKARSPCFATLLNVALPPVRFPSFYFVDCNAVLLYKCIVLLLFFPLADSSDSIPST